MSDGEIKAIDFLQIQDEDFERALKEHVLGPDNARGWRHKAMNCQDDFTPLVLVMARRFGVDPQVAAGLMMSGVNIGYLLRRNVENRRVVLL